MHGRIGRILLCVLLVLGVLGIGACGGSASGDGATVIKKDTDATGGADDSAEEEAQGSSEEPVVGTREKPLQLGTTAKVGDWEVAVAQVNTNATEVLIAENMFNEPPDEGMQYVLVGVQATYSGTESGTFGADVMTKFLGASGNTFQEGFVVAPDPISDTGETFPGASVSGNLVFMVPSTQIEGGSVIMEEFFGNSRTFFALQ